MGKTKRTPVLAHLDPDKAEQLDELADRSRTMKSVLLREAVELRLERRSIAKAVRDARDALIFGRSSPKGVIWTRRCDLNIDALERVLQTLKEF